MSSPLLRRKAHSKDSGGSRVRVATKQGRGLASRFELALGEMLLRRYR